LKASFHKRKGDKKTKGAIATRGIFGIDGFLFGKAEGNPCQNQKLFFVRGLMKNRER
jgi:hypothetical protein